MKRNNTDQFMKHRLLFIGAITFLTGCSGVTVCEVTPTPQDLVFTELAKELLLEKFRDSQKVDVTLKPVSGIAQEQSAKISEHAISTDELSL